MPTEVKAAMAAIAIRAAIRPYSIAVTPFVSSIRRRTVSFPAAFAAAEPSKSGRQPIIKISSMKSDLRYRVINIAKALIFLLQNLLNKILEIANVIYSIEYSRVYSYDQSAACSAEI